MNKDKFILVSAVLVALAFLVIGCAGAAPTVAPPAGATSAPAATTAPAAATQVPTEAPPKALTLLPWTSPSTPFSNLTINVVGDAGHNLLPYQFWKDDFTKAGVNI